MYEVGHELTPAFDVWSFGVTLHTLLTKTTAPWPKHFLHGRDAQQKVVYYLMFLFEDKPPALDHQNLDELSRDLIASTFCAEPTERPSMIDLKQHAFFQEHYPEPKPLRSRKEVMERLTRVIDEGYELTLTAETTTVSAAQPSDSLQHQIPTSKMQQISRPATTLSYTSRSHKRDYKENDTITRDKETYLATRTHDAEN